MNTKVILTFSQYSTKVLIRCAIFFDWKYFHARKSIINPKLDTEIGTSDAYFLFFCR